MTTEQKHQGYNPQQFEEKWYQHWEESNAFRAGDRRDAEPYTIMIPPPNVTGALHIGHALNYTIQDVLARYQRLQGRDVLWLPGCDHAGIATQMVVERNLRQEGLSRDCLGREAFLQRAWKWKEESGGLITKQLRRLGASCDWSRERFTMDEGFCRAVNKVFVTLYEKGLIYRDKRLVNWDPKLKTAISNLEVIQREVQGSFTWIRYPLADKPKETIVVATTRPETMLGDMAVVVHPEDPRYKAMHGRMIAHPLTGRQIPILTDPLADPDLGSGAVKITPAHDFNDFAVGQRHGLDLINIFDEEARINDEAPEDYRGLTREDARERIVSDLDALGLIEKQESRMIMMPYGDRSDVVIEPWLTDQWYVRSEILAQDALEAVASGETRFVPANWDKTYNNWLEDIQPWCISRQLWWGHRIPAWYDAEGRVFVAETETEAREQAGCDIWQDPDVLDTWFSSALWPFATLGWPDDSEDLKRYYPSSTLVTGFDIIFFWVARMMMQGIAFMGRAPFTDVYCHGLVRDAKGQKMSKSRGNTIDPMELIDQYGADALRFTLMAMETQGRDIKLSKQRVEGYRNFGSKLWNAVRFFQMNGVVACQTKEPPQCSHVFNRWIVQKTNALNRDLKEAFKQYRFSDAASLLYSFTWNFFCDWYIELVKPLLADKQQDLAGEVRQCAAWVLDQLLIMLHPMMPHVTEELWHNLGDRDKDLIAQSWPEVADGEDATIGQEIDWLIDLITAIRSARAELNVPAGMKLVLHVQGADPKVEDRMYRFKSALLTLARLSDIHMTPSDVRERIQIVRGQVNYVLPLAGVIDLGAELGRLTKTLDKACKDRDLVSRRLENSDFISRAPQEVVTENKDRLVDLEKEVARLRRAIAGLG